MTVASSTNRVDYTGNGSTTVFSFTFRIFAATDLVVTKADADGVETVLTLNTDYTVTGVGSYSGGSITLGSALTNGHAMTIQRVLPLTQETDLRNQGQFFAETHEDVFDRLAMINQQLQEQVDRSAKLPVTSSEDAESLVADLIRLADSADNIDTVANNIADVNTVADNIADVNTVATVASDIPAVADVASDIPAVAGVASDIPTVAANVADITNFSDVYQGAKASDPALRNNGNALQAGDLYFNTAENALRAYSGTGWVSGTAGTIAVQRFSGDGSDTTFSLASAPAGENNTQVYISGVYQQKDTYSLSDTTITFSSAPPSGADNIEVVTISTLALGETDSSLVSFVQAGAGALERTAQDKLRESVSAEDFGVSGSALASANRAALQAALNSLTSGGTIEISTSFSIDDDVLVPYDNITIRGRNNPLITQATAGKRVFYGPDRANIAISKIRFNGTDSSVAYDGVALDGNGKGLLHFYKSSSTPHDIRIEDCEIYNAFTPISCIGVQNLWVERNTIHNFYKFGVLASKSYNFNIDRNNIYTCDNNTAANTYGVMATGDQAGGSTQQRCSISFNVIDTVASWDGIMTHDCTGLRVIGNDIRNVRCGVDVTYTAATQVIKDVVISGNTISLTSTNNWGTTPAFSAGVAIVGVAASSAYVQGIVVANNIVRNANAISGAVLSGNVYAAIQLDTIVDALITGNVIESFGSANGMDGIAVYNPGDSIKISGNVMRGALGSAGVRALLASGGTATNMSVNDNSVNTSVSSGSVVVFGVASGSGTFNSLVCTGNSTNGTNKNYGTSGAVTLNFEDGDGVFTPVINFGGATTGITYSEQIGRYRKTGDKVWVEICCQLSSKGTATGNLTITGLPFTAKSSPGYNPLTPYIQNMASITGQVVGVVQGTLSLAQMYQISGSTVSVLTDANFANNSRIALQGFITVS